MILMANGWRGGIRGRALFIFESFPCSQLGSPSFDNVGDIIGDDDEEDGNDENENGGIGENNDRDGSGLLHPFLVPHKLVLALIARVLKLVHLAESRLVLVWLLLELRLLVLAFVPAKFVVQLDLFLLQK
jgi:hypothetical protein